MPTPRRFDLDELVNRPGTYLNPQTEVVIVVDDSAAFDAELLGDEEGWLLVSDETPVDESRRDELLERLERRTSRAAAPAADDTEDLADEAEEADDEDLSAAGFDVPDAYDEDDY